LEPVVDLCIQDIQGLEDAPQDKVMLELKKRYYPAPLNADKLGTVEGLESLTPEKLRSHYQRIFQPNKAILSVAGNFQWDQLQADVERLFGGWAPGPVSDFTIGEHAPKSEHVPKTTQQTQIAMAFPSAAITQPGYYAARGAVGVLSGGMSARLFTEVREKRGLCYSVYATHETHKNIGTIVGYAGTRAERAQETLDVMLEEFRKLKDGVTEDEIDRVKAGLKSSLIMRQESPASRAGSLAADFFLLGRVRSFDELKASIDGLTTTHVQDYAAQYGFQAPTVVTLGPSSLEWK
jgi:predicted Zn-dependent peptidase